MKGPPSHVKSMVILTSLTGKQVTPSEAGPSYENSMFVVPSTIAGNVVDAVTVSVVPPTTLIDSIVNGHSAIDDPILNVD